MKRGRIFIYLALIIIVAIVAAGAYWWMHRTPAVETVTVEEPTPMISYVEIVTAGQNISPGSPITEAMLSSIQIPETALVQGLITNTNDVVGMYAKYPISQGVPITDQMISATLGNINMVGSTWSPFIPQGLTAVAIPISRLSSVAYGIRDGDFVDIIVSMLLVDVDPTTQSILPNFTASVLTSDEQQLTAQIMSGGEASRLGTAYLDPTLNQPVYMVPSEGQRPRMVTQMIMQGVQVLHVGNFPLPGEINTNDQLAVIQSGAVATATPGPEGQTAAAITPPDIVTLMVTPDDANTLVFLIYSGVKMTLTLRNPSETGTPVQTDAALLEYLLTQYNIPVPAKLPYAQQPRLDNLLEP